MSSCKNYNSKQVGCHTWGQGEGTGLSSITAFSGETPPTIELNLSLNWIIETL